MHNAEEIKEKTDKKKKKAPEIKDSFQAWQNGKINSLPKKQL